MSQLCKRLLLEFMHYVISSKSLRKVWSESVIRYQMLVRFAGVHINKRNLLSGRD